MVGKGEQNCSSGGSLRKGETARTSSVQSLRSKTMLAVLGTSASLNRKLLCTGEVSACINTTE